MEHPTGSLIDASRRTMLCPRCERRQPLRDFSPLAMSPLYAELLSPIFRCKQCSHVFAPREQISPIDAVFNSPNGYH